MVNKYKGYFIVNYDNFEVIYTDGYENENGMWCYRISDLKKIPEDKKLKQPNLGEQNNPEGQSEEQLADNTEEKSEA